MKRPPLLPLSILLATLALAAAALGFAALPEAGPQPTLAPAVELAQSTTAILEDRAA